MLFSSLALAALLPAAFAAPLAPRADVDTCTLNLNGSVSTMITRSIEDTRSGWVPVKDENGAYTGAKVDTITGTNPAGPYWNITRAIGGGHKLPYTIALIEDPSLCISGTGTGPDPTEVNFVSCESNDALWTVECQRCQQHFGGECEFRPVTGNFGTCATPAEDFGGSIYLRECDDFTDPPQPAQLFSLGIFESS
ncbi:hypothetical protein JCM11641_001821 [Rhodosporidiobolus odoratus]